MYYLKKLLDFYIQSSIHVGFALFSLVYVTAFENDLCKHITYPCCVLFGTILGYNFLKYFEIFQKGKFHSLKYYGIVVVCVLAILGFGFFFIRMSDFIKVQLFDAGIMVLAYPLLRKQGAIKMFWVSFVVAYSTAFIFLFKFATSWEMIFIEISKRFFIVSALMIPFEIYDSKTDALSLNTLPQKFGIEKTKQFGYGFLIIFVLLDFFSSRFKLNYFLTDIFIATVIAVAIYFSSIKRNQYYTSFWVESIPILWWIILIVTSKI